MEFEKNVLGEEKSVGDLNIKFHKTILESGLMVLFEKRDVPVTTVMLATKFGSENETMEEKGMAHFIEHLCFKGTERRTVREISSEVERVGGDLNAFTHEEVTAYHVKIPSNHLKLAMDVLFDVFFFPVFPGEEIQKEANVICEELKMYKDHPRFHTIEKLKEGLYEEPFGANIGGTQENVKGMTRDVLLKKHDEMYVTSNSILCVVGNNDFEEILEIANSLKVRTGSVESNFPDIVLRNKKDSESRTGIEQTNLAIGFHLPGSGGDLKYAAEVFSAILGEGMSSRLFSEVREKRGLVYGVKTDLDIGKNYGYMLIWAGTDKSRRDEVLDICLKEFRGMNDISDEELERAKVQVIGNRDVESESSNDVAVNLIMEEISGDSENYYKYEKKINSVTVEDIRKLSSILEYSVFSLGP